MAHHYINKSIVIKTSAVLDGGLVRSVEDSDSDEERGTCIYV
jgi:hypothetical protein